MTQSARTRAAVAVAAVAALMVPARPAVAYVNPNFTPLDVQRQYKLICLVTAGAAPGGAKAVSLTIGEVIKGKAPAATLSLSLTRALAAKDGPAEVKALLELLAEVGRRPMLLFLPGPDAQAPNVLMHVEGAWLRASPGDDPATVHFDRADTWLNGTFNGGTDMLAATMRFIGRFPDAPVMPVAAGVRWDLHDAVGTLGEGRKAAALRAIDVNGDGKLDVFAACAGGDRVFVAKGDGFAELPGLPAASLAADWADFDGDGRVDLASLARDGLTLYLQAAPGRFQPRAVELPVQLATLSPAVHAADFDADGRADLVVGVGRLPVVLTNAGRGRFVHVPLRLAGAAGKAPDTFGGPSGPCAVADFDGDGRLDIVQCRQTDGVLFRGRPGGGFAPGAACGAAMGPVRCRQAQLADLDGDGRLELLLTGGGRRPVMYVARGGRFEPVSRYMGEPSYIVQAGATAAAPGDVNNDTFVDLFFGYEREPSQCFFNRGFRSLAICEPLKLPADEIEGAEKGQSAALWADMDRDGSMDLLTALSNGRVYLSQTTLGAMKAPTAIAVALGPKAGFAGPLAVTFHTEGYCLGARVVGGAAGPPAIMGLPAPGEYTVKWRLPGKPEAKKNVTVIDSAVTVTIGE